MAVIWNQIVGHEKGLKKLKNMLNQDRFPHACLLAGPSGVGKRKVALAVAQYLLCEQKTNCGQCRSCLCVEKEQHENLRIVSSSSSDEDNPSSPNQEAQSGTLKIEVIRNILQSLSLQPWTTTPRLILINEAHEMNIQASNAFLKTLEEPPPQTYFILISSRPHLLLSTILSRCPTLHLGRLSKSDMIQLGTFPSWVLNSSFGQMDRAQELMDENLLSQRAESYRPWKNLSQKKSAYSPSPSSSLNLPKNLFSDRESSLLTVKFWSELLHEARRRAATEDTEITKTPKENDHTEILQFMSQNPKALDDTWSHLLELQSDLQQHVDRQLASESFWQTIQEVWR